MSRSHIVVYVHKHLDCESSKNFNGRTRRTPISPCVDQGFPSRGPSSRDLSRCFPTATFLRVACYLAQLPAATSHWLSDMSHYHESLPADDSNSFAGVHLQLHGVETHAQFSSRAFPLHGLLCRHARSEQLCFSRTHRNDSLVFAPTAKQMLTIVSSCHTLSVARVPCPLTVALHSESAGSCCHAKMIPVSKHPFKSMAARLNLCQLLNRVEDGRGGCTQWPWCTTSRRTV